ncbi:hypothetical protein EPN90_03045 [Patescibacteria group bacterium]|nr:MAG: hypothetical protein EPN90_03045 [Patescibacteria group bacterium]
MTAFKIGIDFDGVIADTSSLKQEQARLLYGVSIPPHQFKEQLVTGMGILTQPQYRALMRRVCGTREVGLRMAPLPGAVPSLRRLLDGGHRCTVITSREAEELAIASEWCAARGLAPEFVSVGYAKPKVEVARGLDVYIDDDLQKLLPLVGNTPNLFLFHQSYNAHEAEPPEIRRVSSWAELDGHLTRLGA